MTQCHPESVKAWRCLRQRRPYGLVKVLEELYQDVDHLRSCLTRQDLPTCNGFDRVPGQVPPSGRKGGSRPLGGREGLWGRWPSNRRTLFRDDSASCAEPSPSSEDGDLVCSESDETSPALGLNISDTSLSFSEEIYLGQRRNVAESEAEVAFFLVQLPVLPGCRGRSSWCHDISEAIVE
jgi:hypothetical protein